MNDLFKRPNVRRRGSADIRSLDLTGTVTRDEQVYNWYEKIRVKN